MDSDSEIKLPVTFVKNTFWYKVALVVGVATIVYMIAQHLALSLQTFKNLGFVGLFLIGLPIVGWLGGKNNRVSLYHDELVVLPARTTIPFVEIKAILQNQANGGTTFRVTLNNGTGIDLDLSEYDANARSSILKVMIAKAPPTAQISLHSDDRIARLK